MCEIFLFRKYFFIHTGPIQHFQYCEHVGLCGFVCDTGSKPRHRLEYSGLCPGVCGRGIDHTLNLLIPYFYNTVL